MTTALFWRLCAFGYIVSQAQFPPQFIKEPSGYNYPTRNSDNEFGIYTCQSNGSQPIVYAWYYGKFGAKKKIPKWKKDYEKLNFNKWRMAKGGVLTFKQWTYRYDGFYRCTAKNKYGTAVSNAVRLMEPKSPLFPEEPRINYSTTTGDYLIVPCRYNQKAAPKPIYSWDGIDRRNDPNVVTDLEGNLHILYAKKKYGSKEYKCQALNYIKNLGPYGVATWIDVKERVGPVPKRKAKIIFSSPTTSVWAAEWSILYLQCIPSGYPLPKVAWKRKGHIIKESANVHFPHTSKYTLKITPVSEKDAGEYTCYLEEHPSITKTMKVIVKMAPIPTVTPRNTIVVAGSTAEIHCHGRPADFDEKPIHLDWFHNGEKLEPLSQKNGLKVQSNKLIVINANKAKHRLSAACILRNHIGDTTLGFTINVMDEIKILSESVTGELGNTSIKYDSKTRAPTDGLKISVPLTVNLEIKVSVDKLVAKDLRVTWMRNDRKIDNTNPLQNIYVDSNNVFLLTIKADSVTKMEQVSGTYSVKVFIPYVEGSSKTLRMLTLGDLNNPKNTKTGTVRLVVGLLVGFLLLLLLGGLLFFVRKRLAEDQQDSTLGFGSGGYHSTTKLKNNEKDDEDKSEKDSEDTSQSDDSQSDHNSSYSEESSSRNSPQKRRTKKKKKKKKRKRKEGDGDVAVDGVDASFPSIPGYSAVTILTKNPE